MPRIGRNRSVPWFPKRSRGQAVLRQCILALLAIILLVTIVTTYRALSRVIHRHIEEARADAALNAAKEAAQRLKTVNYQPGVAACFDSIWLAEGSLDPACDPVGDFLTTLQAAGLILPRRDYGHEYNRTGICDGGCFFAGNLRDAQLVLPNYIYHLAHTVATLSVHGNPVFVSIYESGSKDRTDAWLEVLQDVLLALRIPFEIKVAGTITREKGEERIHFLARVRSAALAPLQQQCAERGTFCASGMARAPTGASTRSADQAPSSSTGSGPGSGSGRIVFLNDILFAAPDVLRLLQYPVDLVCGLDLGMAAEPDMTWAEHRATVAAYFQARLLLPASVARALTKFKPLRGLIRKFHRKHQPLLYQYGPLFFYDKWVARDISGRLFLNRPPHVDYAPDGRRVAAGKPVRVHCCWNGLAVIGAEPLLRGAVRFREHDEGECSASECSLLCDDLWRLGYTDIVMDPNVRVVYDRHSAARLYRDFQADVPMGAPGIAYAPFRSVDVADVLALPPHADPSREAVAADGSRTRSVVCCDIRKGENYVEFREAGVCHNVTVRIT